MGHLADRVGGMDRLLANFKVKCSGRCSEKFSAESLKGN